METKLHVHVYNNVSFEQKLNFQKEIVAKSLIGTKFSATSATSSCSNQQSIH